jgi:hypothetical protein
LLIPILCQQNLRNRVSYISGVTNVENNVADKNIPSTPDNKVGE